MSLEPFQNSNLGGSIIKWPKITADEKTVKFITKFHK